MCSLNSFRRCHLFPKPFFFFKLKGPYILKKGSKRGKTLMIIKHRGKRGIKVISFLFSIFRENLDRYSMEMQKLTVCLLKFMSRNLGLDLETFPNMFVEGRQGVRLNLYPPCVQANKVIGLSPHSDPNGLSLLVQVNDVQGLQIKKNGKWVPVKPVPGAFIVNIGDIIEVSHVTRATECCVVVHFQSLIKTSTKAAHFLLRIKSNSYCKIQHRCLFSHKCRWWPMESTNP